MSANSRKISEVPNVPHWAALVNESHYDNGDSYPYLKYYAFANADEIHNWLQFQKDTSIIKVLYVEPKTHKTIIQIDGVI